ncbi:MAG: acetyl-CoA carboxylase biotin carboxyl carrier protein [Flammeovirgaceae bacterium]|jgi:acetyl-CoA carboxylase biotin carboxyl carrier protein
MKAKEIKELISFIADSGLEEVKIKTEEIKLSIKKQATVNMVAAPAQQIASQPVLQVTTQVETTSESTPSKPAESADDDSKYITINSPMIGTFYRSANPESDSFVNIGDSVSVGNPVCIIEAMKLFNEIESEVSGKIVKVLVENSTPVEYDQPLFLVDPS